MQKYVDQKHFNITDRFESKKGGKDQELIQLCTTPDQGCGL